MATNRENEDHQWPSKGVMSYGMPPTAFCGGGCEIVVALNFGNLVAMPGVVLHAIIPVVLLVLVVVIVFFVLTRI